MMRKISQKTIRIVFYIIFVVVAIFWGNISLEFGKNIDENTFSQGNVQKSINNIENITGNLIQTPVKVQNYLDMLGGFDEFLYLRIYEFTNPSVKSLFRQLADKGVELKIIVENYKYQQYWNTMKVLQDYFVKYENVKIKSDKQMKTKYVHAKTFVGENKFIIQTSNITKTAFEKNREYIFVSQNENVRKSLKKIFERDWSGYSIDTKDVHPNLLICPVNCRLVIENILSGAKKSIWVQNQYITDLGILEILRGKSEIDIKLILSESRENDYIKKYFGPEIVKILRKYYNHTKMILVDDKYLILSSINLSENSMDNNREIGIILIDEGLIDQFKSWFINDREISK